MLTSLGKQLMFSGMPVTADIKGLYDSILTISAQLGKKNAQKVAFRRNSYNYSVLAHKYAPSCKQFFSGVVERAYIGSRLTISISCMGGYAVLIVIYFTIPTL